MPTQKELEYYLAQARRISEHREKGAEKEIRKQFKTLLQDVRHFISDEYAALAENDELTYAILQQKGDYARFLEEVELLVNNSSPAVQQEITNLVQRVYAISYQGMIEAVDKSTTSEELHEALKGVKGVTPEIVKRAVENPISGLTLADVLEKNRKEIVYELKKQIGIGLTNGDRYSTMAKRIAEQLDMDYRKAVTIARTESHRVREAGYHDSATELNKVLDSGTTAKRLQKTWKTMQDERVRKTSKANHRRLNGVSIPMDEEFDLGHGVKAKAPSQSGDAANDINCRCYLTYELVEVKISKEKSRDELLEQIMFEQKWGEELFDSQKTHIYNQMEKNFTNEEMQFWSKYGGGIKGEFYEKDSGYYTPVGNLVHMDFRGDRAVRKRFGWDANYDTFFHETGHYFDYNTNPNGFDGKPYISRELAEEGLRETLEEEYAKRFDEILSQVTDRSSYEKELREEMTEKISTNYRMAYRRGLLKDRDLDGKSLDEYIADKIEREFNASKSSIRDSYGAIRREPYKVQLRQIQRALMKDNEKYHAVEDIIHGLTRGVVATSYGHYGKGYWSRELALEKETVAHFFEARANKGETLEAIKEWFPESYQMFIEFLKLLMQEG